MLTPMILQPAYVIYNHLLERYNMDSAHMCVTMTTTDIYAYNAKLSINNN